MKEIYKCKLGYAKALMAWSGLGRMSVMIWNPYFALWNVVGISFYLAFIYENIWIGFMGILCIPFTQLPLLRAKVSKLVIDGDILLARNGLLHNWKIPITDIKQIGYRAEVPLNAATPALLLRRTVNKEQYKYQGEIMFSGYVFATDDREYTFPFDILELDKFLTSLRKQNNQIAEARNLPRLHIDIAKKQEKLHKIIFWIFVLSFFPIFLIFTTILIYLHG